MLLLLVLVFDVFVEIDYEDNHHMKSYDHDDLSKYKTIKNIQTIIVHTNPARCNGCCTYGDEINVRRQKSILLVNGL